MLWSSKWCRGPTGAGLVEVVLTGQNINMQMEFDWSIQTVGEWREWLKQVPRSNCMQSWPYAKAVRQSDQKSTRLGLIRLDGVAVGLMALQEIKLGPIHFISLLRGPLWFIENPNTDHIAMFAQRLDQEFPRKLFRRRRWLPEWQNEPSLKSTPHFRLRHESYATAWVDLKPSPEELRRRLNQKWRNALNKAERSGLHLVQDQSGQHLKQFVENYVRDKWSKKYHGPSGRFIKEEFLAALPFRDGFLLLALIKGETVAGIFVLQHGRSATYRVGWTTETGRSLNAHNFLLWNALLICRQNGCENFDLGGIQTKGDQSLNRFKLGIGSEVFETPGMLS